MSNDGFIRYWNSQDVHDGYVRRIVEEPDRVRVFIETFDGRRVVFEFTGVREVRHDRPEDMYLYALAEMRESAPFRRFSFANSDDDDDAYLDVVALDFSGHQDLP